MLLTQGKRVNHPRVLGPSHVSMILLSAGAVVSEGVRRPAGVSFHHHARKGEEPPDCKMGCLDGAAQHHTFSVGGFGNTEGLVQDEPGQEPTVVQCRAVLLNSSMTWHVEQWRDPELLMGISWVEAEQCPF